MRVDQHRPGIKRGERKENRDEGPTILADDHDPVAGTNVQIAQPLLSFCYDRVEFPVRPRAGSFGQSRVVCRVHFASDVEAGRLFGSAVLARLHANRAFLADMKRARTELAAARAPAPAGCTAEKLAAGER